MPPRPKSYGRAITRTRDREESSTIIAMRKLAVVFAIWVAAACAVDGNATAPTDAMPAASPTGSHVVPLLLVLQTPPVRAPANIVRR